MEVKKSCLGVKKSTRIAGVGCPGSQGRIVLQEGPRESIGCVRTGQDWPELPLQPAPLQCPASSKGGIVP